MNAHTAALEINACTADLAKLNRSFTATWRERSRERLSREPAHAEANALWFSLEAIDEAIGEGREFSWTCSDRERVAVLDRCVAKAAGRLV